MSQPEEAGYLGDEPPSFEGVPDDVVKAIAAGCSAARVLDYWVIHICRVDYRVWAVARRCSANTTKANKSHVKTTLEEIEQRESDEPD